MYQTFNMTATDIQFPAPEGLPFKSLRFFVFSQLSTASNNGHRLIRLYQRAVRLRSAAHYTKLQHQFLTDCMAEQVLPNCLKHLSSHNSSGHPFPPHWEEVLKDRIASAARERDEKFRRSHHAWKAFLDACPGWLAPWCRNLIEHITLKLIAHRFAKHNDKL